MSARVSFAPALAAFLLASTASAQEPPTPADIADALSCRMLLSVAEDGAIQLAQVAESSGSWRLDGACLNAIIVRRFKPSADDAPRLSHWVMFTAKMILHLPHKEAQAAQAHAPIAVPVLSHDQPLDLTHYRDTTADAPLPSPVCATHVVVPADGTLPRLTITTSTGSSRWDAACLEVIRGLTFSPAQREGNPVSAATNIWINWQGTKPPL